MTAADLPPEPPWWTPPKNSGPRRSLTRAAILAAARPILRAEGVDGLSMRRLATELGTGPASLYAHVANKDELLDLLFDQVVGEIALPEPDPARWREQFTALWTEAHETLMDNGDIARVSLGKVPLGPNAMRAAETMVVILTGAGIPAQPVAWALDAVPLYVAASAVENAIGVAQARAGNPPEEHYARVGAYFATLSPAHYPLMSTMARELAEGGRTERFAFGLDLLVRGLESHITPRR
ncbi:TetR/AcrR family transcriptional regulator [Actinokineospora diospyrosa]|uniref:Transcriptional regulator, TetR family n=1 Tax=Actinokineospora diospyrosa TaxID=103728 RepID=A0ABT1I8T5_9PSEU|nr:TetR/AcrR family transcriptional regulator [Actinokineospora diospyrosa]MCP2269045.1 transcriptional regulator, TetR family [Actinokineospora diospyrosa]